MKAFRLTIAVILVLGLAFWLWGNQTEETAAVPSGSGPTDPIRPMEEGDRPPIIISDGSVDFFVDFNGNKYGRGIWEQTDADGKQWVLTPGKDGDIYDTRQVASFRVTILNVKENNPEACKNPDKSFDVKTFTVNFKNTGTDAGNATVGIASGKVQVVFDGGKGDRDEHLAFWLETRNLLGQKKLRSVTLGADTCEFAGGNRGIIRIKPILVPTSPQAP